MKSLITWSGIVFLGIVLAGCAGQSNVQPAQNAGGTTNAQSQTNGMNGSNANQGQQLGAQNAAQERPAHNKVYFGFDQSNIQPQYAELLKKTANYLLANPNQNVRLEGYTDERGTKAYNMALGARRAQSVKQFLMLQGVAPGQLETVSYGEENPANPAHNEAAWAQNRRVVIVYK